MHQANRIRARERTGVEFRFLPNERCDQKRIEPIGHGILAQIAPVRPRKQSFPIRTRQVGNVDGEIVRRGALHDLDAAIVASAILIHACHLRRRPASAFLDRGRLQFAHGQIGQPAVGKQPRARHTQVVVGRLGLRNPGGSGQRRNMVEQRVVNAVRGRVIFAEALQSLATEFGVIVIVKAVAKFLIERARHAGIVLFLGQTSSPVKRGGNLGGIGIERDLIFETFAGVFGPSLAKVQPRRLPMRIGSAHAIRETLLEFAEMVDGAIVILLQQIHVARRKERLLEPRAGRTELPQLVQGLEDKVLVAGGTRSFGKKIEPLGLRVALLHADGGEKLPRIVAAVALLERRRQRQLEANALRRRSLIDKIAIFVRRFVVVFALE